jgi:hypothetical protein
LIRSFALWIKYCFTPAIGGLNLANQRESEVKKLFLFIAAFLIFGLETSSFALQAEIPADSTAPVAKGGTQITIGGELRVRGSIIKNTDNLNNAGSATAGAAGKPLSESGTKPSTDRKN